VECEVSLEELFIHYKSFTNKVIFPSLDVMTTRSIASLVLPYYANMAMLRYFISIAYNLDER